MTIIETNKLKKEYRNKNRKVVALKETTLSFASSGLVFLLGESGAGKSTLLNLLSLQEKPTSGGLLIEGSDISSLSGGEKSSLKNEDFAILFQDLNLLEEFSVYDNLRLAREIQGKSLGKEEAIQILSRFSLPENIIDEMPFSLSGGQRQRVALARALVKDFKVLFCDEPTASLDDENATIVAESLKEIAKDHLVIAATHDTEIAKKFGNRIITIKDGAVCSDTGTETVQKKEKSHVQNKKTHRHLPLKTLFKLSMHGVKTSVPRFIFALISTFLTLSVFMVSMSFYCYDEIETTYACLRKEGISYLELIGNEEIDKTHNNRVYFSYDEKGELEGYFGSSLGFSISKSSGIFNKAKKERPEETGYYEKAYFFCPTDTENFGFKVIGKMPEYNPSSLEIALTKYDCYLLGYTEDVSSNDTSIYEDIINNNTFEIEVPSATLEESEKKQARVTAVIDTNFKVYSNEEKKDVADAMKSLELDTEAHFGVYFDETTYKTIVNGGSGTQHVYVPTSARPLEKVSEYNSTEHQEKGDTYSWLCLSRFDKSIEAVRNTQKTFSGVALAISMSLLVIAGLAFVSFIVSSVTSLRPSVMILESLGVSKASATGIYASEALLLGLVCGLASVLPYYWAVEWFGSFLAKEVLLPVSPFSFNFAIMALSILGVCLLAIVVAGVVSVVSKAKRQ